MERKLRSFTLVELMVVITVILILTVFTVITLGPARARSRDTRRINDANIIVSALNQYYTEHSRTYPTEGDVPDSTDNEYYAEEINSNSLLASKMVEYINSIPEDPSGGEGFRYVYVYRGDGKEAAVIVDKLEALQDRCNIGSGTMPEIVKKYIESEVTGLTPNTNACYFVKN
jgi:type II secretory pathway pseudopilin PulG